MKKAAVKWLVILVGIVLVCVFFSGTLHSITTAKVQMTKPKTGKLTTEITMTGNLYWPSTRSLFITEMKSEDTLTVRRVAVSAGSYVKSGDLIAECDVTDADARLASLRESYSAREKEYLELEIKNRQLQITPQQNDWYQAYETLKKARQAEQDAEQDLRLAAWKAGITLSGTDELPAGIGDEATLNAWETLKTCMEEAKNAQAAFDHLSLFPLNDDAVAYMEKKTELENEMTGISDQISDLRILIEAAAYIRAPYDAFITSSELRTGDTLNRNTPLVQMTEEGIMPVIRLDPGSDRKVFTAGIEAELTAGDRSIPCVVSATGLSAEGKPCVDVKITREDIGALGGINSLTETGAVTARIKWLAESSSTLIPNSALRGTEGDYYVYVIKDDEPNPGSKKSVFHRITRKNVTVLGQSDMVTSVSENLRSNTLVHMEDRPLSDGCEVMPYDER